MLLHFEKFSLNLVHKYTCVNIHAYIYIYIYIYVYNQNWLKTFVCMGGTQLTTNIIHIVILTRWPIKPWLMLKLVVEEDTISFWNCCSKRKSCRGVFRMLSNICEDNSCKKIHYKCLIESLDMRLINLEKWPCQALIIEKMQAAQLCNHLRKDNRSLLLCLSTWISGSRRRWDTITSGITKLLPKISKVCQWNIMSIS